MSYNVEYIAVNSKKRWKVIATLYNFFNVSAIYTKSCAQIIFPPIFGLFAIFDRNFAQLVSPPSDENENYVVDLKGLWILKKKLKIALKSAYKRQRSACSNYAPRTNTAPA